MRMNRNKDLGINMRICSMLIFACVILCLGGGARGRGPLTITN